MTDSEMTVAYTDLVSKYGGTRNLCKEYTGYELVHRLGLYVDELAEASESAKWRKMDEEIARYWEEQ